ncbi:hypothetical protein QE152_g1944 [Popillia japonica]|uniref:Uncharacterized protein n=1 Tax=Popillia japonica TaxID=7064 RepID=A0AAW1N4S7_POPJA
MLSSGSGRYDRKSAIDRGEPVEHRVIRTMLKKAKQKAESDRKSAIDRGEPVEHRVIRTMLKKAKQKAESRRIPIKPVPFY